MKALAWLALAGLSCMAAADGQTQFAQKANATDVERYEYATNLDIARVIHTENIPDDICEVVPIHIFYEDSHGERHTLEYSVMGGHF
ncbi:DUF2790 domain-containing protein [Azorhizophilus paspali]|uniref:DUF2790 domain-containing protein n=1 Tax=Azorhizophilus paspali TaxID=69963 RepID=A0ABV6SLP4_AZOPA